MTTLTRLNPLREMMTLRSAMDQMFDNTLQSMHSQLQENGPDSFSLALDVSENENEYVVQASVPGIAEDDLDITLNNHMLTIAGEFKSENEQEDVKYHLLERRYGRFSRSIVLPSAVNEDEIEADFNNGILTIHLPKAEEAKPKRIAVQGQHQVEAKAS